MSVLNYSAPFVAPAPALAAALPSAPASSPYFAGGLDGLGATAAVNNFLYTNDPYHQHHSQYRGAVPAASPTSSPSRRTAASSRDPYRNQIPRVVQQQHLQQQQQHLQQQQQHLQQQLRQQQQQLQQQHVQHVQHTRSYYEPAARSPAAPQQQQQQQQAPATSTRYTRIDTNVASPRAKTTLHAVIDYDDDFAEDEYYDDEAAEEPAARYPATGSRVPSAGAGVGGRLQGRGDPAVTPIQGPIYVKNGSVPVVPLFSYPVLNNGSYVQIPILWTALSLALGLEIRGEIIRGVPCIKRFHQLFCPTAGNSYPIERIERFIDDNKSLMRRMYGEFQMTTEYGPPAREVFESSTPGGGGLGAVKRRSLVKRAAHNATSADPPPPDPITDTTSGGTDSFFAKIRSARQSFRNNQSQSETGRLDACESKVEIVTPYWASNSAGKIRAIVNTQHFEQAIHQEVCAKPQTKRCSGDCGCEQKYKWHRLLAYDPDNDCKGIFMDWFLFPSCCVCRCAP